MVRRKKLSPDAENYVLTNSKRRCVLCYGLNGDLEEKRGQIAHLDKNCLNDAEENLAYLCFHHHDAYDSSTSQSKNYTKNEIKYYRNELYKRLNQNEKSDSFIAEVTIRLYHANDVC